MSFQQRISGSSNSSHSSDLDSPSLSMDHSYTGDVPAAESAINSYSQIQQQLDSDDELIDMDWASTVPLDVLQSMNNDEKKRQEVINGNFLGSNFK